MKQVLAVINDWPQAERVLTQSREIAAAINASVYVYCPVSSQIEELNRYVGFENFDQVKAELMAQCQSRLEQLPGMDDLEYRVEWQSQVFKGVADKAEAISAEIIVMCQSAHNIVGDFLHKPDDWHLLRDSHCPVLIISQESRAYNAVVAALDAMEDSGGHQDLNARILDEAQLMAETLKLPLKVITVVPEPAYIYSEFAILDSTVISQFRDDAEAYARAKQQQMLGRLGINPQLSLVVIGRIDVELQKALSDNGLLVIGTIANKGLKGFFIGNTCERLLSHLEGDMLVVN